ncbi:MAG: CAP domain-containing protein [Myxococcales bacterium]|nr:CAP domain-containing protein [Myxococcales bacterium]
MSALLCSCGSDARGGGGGHGGSCPAPEPAACASHEGGDALPFDLLGDSSIEGMSMGGASCGGSAAPEVAIQWTAPYAGTFRFSTEGTGFDTVLSVRSSCGGEELGCNDDVSGGVLTSEIEVDLSSCRSVIIVVGGFGSADAGAFELHVQGRELLCDDGLDNDGDGAADCEDLDCFSAACSGTDAWPAEWAQLERDMLAEINRYRALGADCGTEGVFAAAPPMEMDETVRIGARLHSADMGAQDYFDHLALDGRDPFDRMADTGFAGPFPWGENIAAGNPTAAGAMEGLMASDGHCANIMNPEFNVVGLGYAFTAGSTYGHYWTQNFAGGH